MIKYYITLHYIALYYFILYYITVCYIILYMLYCIVSCYIILYLLHFCYFPGVHLYAIKALSTCVNVSGLANLIFGGV